MTEPNSDPEEFGTFGFQVQKSVGILRFEIAKNSAVKKLAAC